MQYITESKEEACSAASKLVKIKITRIPQAENCPGPISAFECNSETASCRSCCLYRMLMNDD